MALTKVTSDGITDGTIIGTDLATNVDLVDNKKIRFGTGNDLSIYHDGTSSFLSNTTGDLKIDSDSIKIRQSNGNAFIKCQNTATELYFADNKKLETTSSGATITGSLGIGTTSPAANLHVHTDSNGEGVLIKSTGNTSNALTFDANRGTEGVIAAMYGRWNGTTVAQINFISGADGTNKDDGIITFGTESAASNGNVNASEKMRLDSSGRVGIGTTTGAVGGAPSSQTGQFNVISSAASGQWAMQARADNAAGNGLFLRAGANSSYYTAYLTGNDENNVHMVVRGDGNVGIGTSSPSGKLHVEHSGELNSYFVGNTSTSGSRIILWNKNTTANSFTGVLGADAGGQTTASINFYSADNDTNEGYLNLETRPSSGLPTERMRIDSSGRVGIGTTSPLKKLHIADAGDVGLMLQTTNAVNDKEIFEISVGGNASNHADLIFRTRVNAGTGGSEVMRLTNAGRVLIGVNASYANSEADNLQVGNNNSSDPSGITLGSSANSSIRFSDAGNATDGWMLYNHSETSLRFGANNAERMRINSSGHLLVSCTSFPSSSVSGVAIANTSSGTTFSSGSATNSQTHVVFINGNGVVGTIKTDGSATEYNTSSDYRLKENAVAISDGITKLKTLKPYRFNFKADASKTVDGFFAHEVTAVPEAISGTKDEVALADDENKNLKKGDPIYQGIDQSKLVPLLTAALQEAIAKIEVLETEVAALKAG